MEEEIKNFVYHKNQWQRPEVKKNPNIRNEKIGTLWLDGKPYKKGNFALLQVEKMRYCRNYGISRENAKKRFKITY